MLVVGVIIGAVNSSENNVGVTTREGDLIITRAHSNFASGSTLQPADPAH
jgi:hypothetical protein